jgi:putative ABC transport system permease protein
MLQNYLKVAWRNLFKNKSYTFINILGLAVSIAVCVMIFSFVSHEFSYDTFHEKSDRTYRVTLSLDQNDIALSPSMVFPTMRQRYPSVETGVRVYAAGRSSPAVVSYEDNVFEEEKFAYADSTFLDVFSFELLNGNRETALNRPNTVVISKAMAGKYFGDINPIGETITLNNERTFEVTGVMQNMPDNSHITMDFICSLSTLSSWSELQDNELRGAQFYTYLVLQENALAEEFSTKVNDYFQDLYPGNMDISMGLQPLTDIHLYSDLESEIQPQGDIAYVWAASAIALLILIIACINYMNLATARSARRSQEVGIRKVLGSSRKRLVMQFYGESALITLLAMGCSVLLIELFSPWFNQLVGQQINIAFTSPFTLSILAGTGLLITLMAGSYPAILLSSFSPVAVLKGSQSKSRSSYLRKGLVVFQFAMSVILIIGTLVIYQQIDFVQQKELGHQKENVLVLTSYSEVERRFDTFKSLLQRRSGIEQATMVSETPTNIGGGYTIQVDGIPNSDRNVIAGLRADHHFTKTLDIPIKVGRSFNKSDYEQTNSEEEPSYSFLINESMVDYLRDPAEELIGRRTELNGRVGTITGVVENFHFAPLHKSINPLVIFPEDGFNKMLVRFSTTDIQKVLSETQEVWGNLFPQYPMKYQFLDQEYEALYQQETRAGNMFGQFAFLAIFIACLGLLGLSAYTAEQRTKEIGVRKVLGASVSQLVLLMSKDFTKLVLVAIAIGIPAGWWVMSTWLQDYSYRIDLQIWHFAAAGGISLLIAWITVSWQALKAATVNPVQSLRSE